MIHKSPDDAIWQSVQSNLLITDLTEQQLESVRKHACCYELETGQALFRQGEAIHSFYILVSGRLKLSRLSPDGGEKVFDIINAGQSFAEAVVLTGEPGYPVSCLALEPSLAVGFDAAHFKSLLENNSQACFNLIARLSRRLHWHVNEMDQLAQYNAACRLGWFLLFELESNRAGSTEVELNVPKNVLASRLSIKPETFSRTLKRLSKLDLIEVQDNRIKVLDVERLEQHLKQGEL